MKSLAELAEYREKMKTSASLRNEATDETRVLVGMATCGIAAGARPVLAAFTEEIEKRQIKEVKVTQTGCIGICKLEPIVQIVAPGQDIVTYVRMTADMVPKVIVEHLVNGRPVLEYTVSHDL